MQNKAKSEENQRSDTKGFSTSVNKFTTIITSFNMFVANGPTYRTTYNIILSGIRVPFSVCSIYVHGTECLQFSFLKVILQLSAELIACGPYTYVCVRCVRRFSLVSHGLADFPSVIFEGLNIILI